MKTQHVNVCINNYIGHRCMYVLYMYIYSWRTYNYTCTYYKYTHEHTLYSYNAYTIYTCTFVYVITYLNIYINIIIHNRLTGYCYEVINVTEGLRIRIHTYTCTFVQIKRKYILLIVITSYILFLSQFIFLYIIATTKFYIKEYFHMIKDLIKHGIITNDNLLTCIQHIINLSCYL